MLKLAKLAEPRATRSSGLDLRVGIALGVTIIFWASAFAGIQVGLKGYTPAQLALLRYISASVVLVIYAAVTHMPLPRRRDLPALFGFGFLGFTLYNIALNAGEQQVSAGVASFIIASEVGVIALLSRFFSGERLRLWGWLGVVVAFLGVGLISLSTGEGLQISSGAVLVFVATLSVSVYSVGQKPLLKRYSAMQFTTYAIWAGTICLLFFAPGLPRAIAAAPFDATAAVVYMGILPGVVAYASWSYILSRIPAAQAGATLTLIPVTAMIIAWLWLGEVPTTLQIAGGATVLTGVAIVNTIGRADRGQRQVAGG
jgi:drug/metabolite transporter (DMT)-like permease